MRPTVVGKKKVGELYRSFSCFWPHTGKLCPFKISFCVEGEIFYFSLEDPVNWLALQHLLNKSLFLMWHGSEKIVTFFSYVFSIIPPFLLKWTKQIFLPLILAFFLLCQMGPQSLATLKMCQGITGFMKERSFSKKCNTSHNELKESPGSLRQMKQVSLSVSVLQARGSCCATRLPGDCKADSTILSKHSFH